MHWNKRNSPKVFLKYYPSLQPFLHKNSNASPIQRTTWSPPMMLCVRLGRAPHQKFPPSNSPKCYTLSFPQRINHSNFSYSSSNSFQIFLVLCAHTSKKQLLSPSPSSGCVLSKNASRELGFSISWKTMPCRSNRGIRQEGASCERSRNNQPPLPEPFHHYHAHITLCPHSIKTNPS